MWARVRDWLMSVVSPFVLTGPFLSPQVGRVLGAEGRLIEYRKAKLYVLHVAKWRFHWIKLPPSPPLINVALFSVVVFVCTKRHWHKFIIHSNWYSMVSAFFLLSNERHQKTSRGGEYLRKSAKGFVTSTGVRREGEEEEDSRAECWNHNFSNERAKRLKTREMWIIKRTPRNIKVL